MLNYHWWIGVALCLLPTTLLCQNGFRLWENLQKDESHLQATYKEKKVYVSEDGDPKNAQLRQEQFYEKGRLVRDVVYQAYPDAFLYDIQFTYLDSAKATALNVVDSTTTTYAFTPSGKIRYYLVERNPDLHIIYTYQGDTLVRCKDCMNPLEDHTLCVYYQYEYNKEGQLQAVKNYYLPSKRPVEERVLMFYDSLVYNEEKLLQQKITINAEGTQLNETTYTYDKRGRLEREYSTQSTAYQYPRSYEITYQYYCGKQVKWKIQRYFKERIQEGANKTYYNKKGYKTKTEIMDADDKVTKMYRVEYK